MSKSQSPGLDPARAERRAILWQFICGSLFACLAALILARIPLFHPHSLPLVLLAALLLVLVTAQAGIIGVWIARLMLRRPVAASFSAAWLFLPAFALLFWDKSLWLLGLASLIAALLTLALRSYMPPALSGQPQKAAHFASFYGTPAPDARFGRGLLIALALQATAIAVFRQWLPLAAILLATALTLFLWSWTSVESPSSRGFIRIATPKRLSWLAFLLTVVLMLPPAFLHRLFAGGGGARGNMYPKSPSKTRAKDAGYDYVGIILWPPPPKKATIVPPREHGPGAGEKSRPIVIPFDGPYWYFKYPHSEPGRFAHVVRGKKATQIKISSTNWSPLQTEAHQNLGLPIQTSCCSAIEVTVENADHEVGGVAVGLLLTDAAAGSRKSMNLGFKTLLSSESELGGPTSGTTQETLRFPMPKAARIQQFNSITVLFMPAASHARQGVKVAVDSFTLVP